MPESRMSVINVPSIAAKSVHITKIHVLTGCKNDTLKRCPIYRNAGTVQSMFGDLDCKTVRIFAY